MKKTILKILGEENFERICQEYSLREKERKSLYKIVNTLEWNDKPGLIIVMNLWCPIYYDGRLFKALEKVLRVVPLCKELSLRSN